MHQTIYNKQQAEILHLFRRKAVYTRDEMRVAAAGIYKTNEVMFGALTKLAIAGFLQIRRCGNNTWRKRGIAAEYRLTIHGLDWLAAQGYETPTLVFAPKKPRKVRAVVTQDAGEKQACGVVMRVCYSTGCYLRQTCNAYKGNW